MKKQAITILLIWLTVSFILGGCSSGQTNGYSSSSSIQSDSSETSSIDKETLKDNCNAYGSLSGSTFNAQVYNNNNVSCNIVVGFVFHYRDETGKTETEVEYETVSYMGPGEGSSVSAQAPRYGEEPYNAYVYVSDVGQN